MSAAGNDPVLVQMYDVMKGQNSAEVRPEVMYPITSGRMENMTGTILKESTAPARQEGQTSIPAAPVQQAPEDVPTGQAGDAALSLT